jgi:hypothetical protein
MKTHDMNQNSCIRPLTVGLLVLLGLASSQPSIAAEVDAGSNIGLKLMTERMGAPIGLVPIPDGSGRLLVAEQAGVIQLLDKTP